MFRHEVVDDWGVPHRLFGGPIPADFAAGLARIAMLSAALDGKLHGLLSTVGSEPQDKWAGKSTEALVAQIQSLVRTDMPARKGASQSLLGRIEDAAERSRTAGHERNELLHAVWPSPHLQDAIGWKALPKAQRLPDKPWEWTRGVTTDRGRLRRLVEEQVLLLGAIDDLRQEVEQLERTLPTAPRA